MENEKLVERSDTLGQDMLERLQELKSIHLSVMSEEKACCLELSLSGSTVQKPADPQVVGQLIAECKNAD